MENNLNNCLAMQERAKQLIPGMTQLLSKRPDMFSMGVWPGYYSKAKGAEIWDLDGNHYIDMSISGIGANVLGYADPDIDAAVIEVVTSGNSSSLNCPEEVELAELICSLHPWANMVRLAKTGGEAMAIAVRIARAFTGRDKIAFCGYHGWHDWYLSANLGTENALGEHLLSGLSPNGVPKGLSGTSFPFRYNRFDDFQEIVDIHGPQTAAVVMEPIRGQWPANGFLAKVKELTNKIGAVFIFDEISAGFRLCSGGAHKVLSVDPDIAVFSKALGNGYPIAAIIGKTDVMQSAQNTFISSTNWTERIGPAAAIATIKKFQERDVSKHLVKVGEMVQQGWKHCAEKYNLDISVSGIPPLSHFVFNSDDGLALKAYFIQLMIERGFLASNLFYAMFAHEEIHVEKYMQAVDSSFKSISMLSGKESIEQKLRGKPSVAGFRRIT